jgi:hypothetical protein
MEAGMSYPAAGNKHGQEKGTKLLARLTEIMYKAQLPRSNRERILQEFMPYLGFSPETQRLMIRDMTGSDDESTEAPFARVHPGSATAPEDSEVRKLASPDGRTPLFVHPSKLKEN